MNANQDRHYFLNADPDLAPLDALADTGEPSVLAIITETQGPSYRSVGSVMAFLPGDRCIGSLSSGCIEADLAIHARAALGDGQPRTILYGQGSPYMDIQLPCGGGLEILLVPRPDRSVLKQVIDTLANRQPGYLSVHRQTGVIQSIDESKLSAATQRLVVRYEPELRFFIFGKGPEAATFAELSHAIGYQSLLLSPDSDTLSEAATSLCPTKKLVDRRIPETIQLDAWSAVVLFFHDHDWEPPIIAEALNSDAFYIGAQGSQRARDARLAELMAMGIDASKLERVRGPIGLVPSARDPRTLAVSVMAEVLATAKQG